MNQPRLLKFKASCRRLVRREEGNTLIEFCLVLTILLAVMLGTIELCLGFFAYNEITESAREAARWAMVRGSTSCANTPSLSYCGAQDTDIRTYVQNMKLPLLVASNITVTTKWYQAVAVTNTTTNITQTTWTACSSITTCPYAGKGNDPGNQVQVTTSYNLPLFLSFWKSNKFSITGSTWNLSSTGAMVISQ